MNTTNQTQLDNKIIESNALLQFPMELEGEIIGGEKILYTNSNIT